MFNTLSNNMKHQQTLFVIFFFFHGLSTNVWLEVLLGATHSLAPAGRICSVRMGNQAACCESSKVTTGDSSRILILPPVGCFVVSIHFRRARIRASVCFKNNQLLHKKKDLQTSWGKKRSKENGSKLLHHLLASSHRDTDSCKRQKTTFQRMLQLFSYWMSPKK